MKVYVDTNVYLDLFLNRKGKYVDFAAEAARLFDRAQGCEFEIIVSAAVIAELHKKFPECRTQFLELRAYLAKKCIFTQVLPRDVALAKSFQTHIEDALHMAIAERMGATAIITRNVPDFMQSSLIVSRPESL